MFPHLQLKNCYLRALRKGIAFAAKALSRPGRLEKRKTRLGWRDKWDVKFFMHVNYTMNTAGMGDLLNLIGGPAELLQQYYGLTPKRGKVCCPFHADKTPSMKVDDRRVHCFGCGWHGDSLDIYAKANNLTLQEAIRNLRHQAGESGERWREKALEAKRRRQIESRIHEEAAACFRSVRQMLHGIEKMLPCFHLSDAEDETRQAELQELLQKRQAADEVLPVFYSGERLQDLDGLRAARGAGLWP